MRHLFGELAEAWNNMVKIDIREPMEVCRDATEVGASRYRKMSHLWMEGSDSRRALYCLY